MNLPAAPRNLVRGDDLSPSSFSVRPKFRVASILLIVLLWAAIYTASCGLTMMIRKNYVALTNICWRGAVENLSSPSES
jgi:hypothetical protein